MTTGRPTITLSAAFAVVDRLLADRTVPDADAPVRDAVGRTLAEDQASRLDLPPFDKSAMDGYALPDDGSGPYRVLETVAAGNAPTALLSPGTTLKVMTGAPVPAGTRRVAKIEDVQVHGNQITVARPERATNICARAEDVRIGDVVLKAGAVLSPLDVANLISCGVTDIHVCRRLRLTVLSTGDEIVDDPAQLSPGKIMNANGPMLAALGRQFGMTVVGEQSVPDEPGATVAAIRAAVAAADLVVLTGGVSVGDFDVVQDALVAAGLTAHFTQAAIKPGRPLTFATTPTCAVFGLPGNPVSAYLMFHLFVLRAAARLTGAPVPGRELTLPLGFDFRRRKTDRTEFIPCRIAAEGRVEELEFHGSAHLTALTAADGFFIVPLGQATLARGEPVQVFILPGSWR